MKTLTKRTNWCISKRTSAATKDAIAEDLTLFSDGVVRLTFEPNTFETIPYTDNVPMSGTRGHLWECHVGKFEEMPYVNDVSGEDMRLLLADALDDYIAPLIGLVTRLREAAKGGDS